MDQNLLNQWTDTVLPHLKAQYEGLNSVKDHDLNKFLAGLLYRLRTGGGIVHPVLKQYIQDLGRSQLFLEQRLGTKV